MANPLPGDIQLTDVQSDTGTLIHWMQIANGDGFGHYEHARIYIGHAYMNNGDFVEAEPGGARRASHPVNNGYWSSGLINLTTDERIAICDAALKYVGTPYSWLDYAALAAHRFRIPYPGLKNYVANSGHMICSQLVDQCYVDAGVHLFADHRWPGYVTPGDLWQLLEAKRKGK